ncbi:Glycerophosphodiester phosphodiesterase [Bertholletia excelsa]
MSTVIRVHCGHLNLTLEFPYSNHTHPDCGLAVVNCSHNRPFSYFDDSQQYFVEDWNFTNRYSIFKVSNQLLGDLISDKSCDFIAHFHPLNTSSVSFTFSPNLPLFKCRTGSPEVRQLTRVYFRHYSTYEDCSGYTIYFNSSNIDIPPPISYPSMCSVIQVPVKSSIRKGDTSNLFSLLSAKFDIQLHVSEGCLECYHRGGRCSSNYKKEFSCLKNKECKRAILFVFIRRKLSLIGSTVFKNKTEDCQKVAAFLKNYGSHFPRRYTYSEITRLTNSFRVKLGQGGFGCVFKGKLDNGFLVAVKVLQPRGNGEEFINEVAAISRTSHVNIVNLLGFCFEGHKRALVYEFMPNGSLERFIHKGKSFTSHQFSWETLYKIAVGIARGLEYLHRGCNMRILHLDIKPHNILLDENFCPKISDFGLAKLCPEKESLISLLSVRGTVGYIAPEAFCKSFGTVSHKSDVYSYGMMILEMIGERRYIVAKVDHTSEVYFPHWIYGRLELNEELGLDGLTSNDSNENARKMIIVGLWCIQLDSSHRPSMSRVVEMLEGKLESLQIPPKPCLSSPSRSPLADSSTSISARALHLTMQ